MLDTRRTDPWNASLAAISQGRGSTLLGKNSTESAAVKIWTETTFVARLIHDEGI
jgi:hypothetical protein